MEQDTEVIEPEARLCAIDHGLRTPLIEAVKTSLDDAFQDRGKLPAEVLDIKGMSGKKYRLFINNLVERTSDARYLEIGSWVGSTLCAALHGNSVRSLAIDTWSQFGGIREFFSNVSKSCSSKTQVSILTQDFRSVEYRHIGRFNIYMFDGPHDYQDQFDALSYPLMCLDEQFVYIVDDWNWERVRNGTFAALRELNLTVLFQVEIRTTLDNTHPKSAGKWSDWHNGYFIAVLQR